MDTQPLNPADYNFGPNVWNDAKSYLPNLEDQLAEDERRVRHYRKVARKAKWFGRFGFANRATREPSRVTPSRPSGRVSAIAYYVTEPSFLLGVFVGCWFTVAASFGVAFL